MALARVLLELADPGAFPAISAKRQRQLEASLRRLDRYADFGRGRPGVGVEVLVDVIRGDWRGLWPSPRSRPRTLGGIAVCVRRLANEWRRHDRARRRR